MKTIILAGMINLDKREWSEEQILFFRKQLTYENPEYKKTFRINRYAAKKIPQSIYTYKENDTYFAIPRAFYYLIKPTLANTFKLNERDLLCEGKEIQLNSNISLKTYQQKAVDTLLSQENNIGILCSPPGSGKTVMALYMISSIGLNALVLVHTIDLLKQWSDRIFEFLPRTKVGLIGDGNWFEGDITIATVQSLTRYFESKPEDKLDTETFKESYGTVILDEAHHCPASTFCSTIQQFPSKHRYGLTATPERADKLHPILYHVCGNIVSKVEYEDLFKDGQIIRPTVEVIETDFEYYYENPQDWHPLIRRLIRDERRNEMIIQKLVEEKDKTCLVLSNRIEHLNLLCELAKKQIPSEKMFILTSKVPGVKRKEVLQSLREGKINIVFATQLADEGLDVINLDTLFLTFPAKFSGKIKQQVGRIVRKAEGKSGAKVYDFADVKVSVLNYQFRNRQEHVYKELGFDIRTTENRQEDN